MMIRSQIHRHSSRMKGPKIGLIMTTALASVALSGCTASAAPRADTSFSKAQNALEDGKIEKAVTHAEAAVLADPRNAGYRALLGAAYLESGRFEAAATSFNDAIELGDNDARTILSFALASIANDDSAGALAALNEWEGAIDAADLGLAYALAGKPERGVHALANALRNGHNTAKVRQNLAYTYALAGNWRGARVMAAEDVPADQLDTRLGEWAATAGPENHQVRVANLLGVSPSGGAGQPQQLALSNFPSQQQLVAEAEVQADAAPTIAIDPSEDEQVAFGITSDEPAEPSVERVVTVSEPARAAAPVPVPAPTSTPTPVVTAAPAQVTAPVAAPSPASTPTLSGPVRSAAPRFVSNAVVQTVPETARETRPAPRRVAAASSQRRMAATSAASSDKKADTHMVQLGSYDTRAVAKAKWKEFQNRFPQLKAHDVVITKAEVKGRIFYRVAASGFGVRSARDLCSTVKSSGRGCFAYAKASPPKGAIDSGVRIAARSR